MFTVGCLFTTGLHFCILRKPIMICELWQIFRSLKLTVYREYVVVKILTENDMCFVFPPLSIYTALKPEWNPNAHYLLLLLWWWCCVYYKWYVNFMKLIKFGWITFPTARINNNNIRIITSSVCMFFLRRLLCSCLELNYICKYTYL